MPEQALEIIPFGFLTDEIGHVGDNALHGTVLINLKIVLQSKLTELLT